MSSLGPFLVTLVLVALLVGVRRPARSTVTVEGDVVRVHLAWADKALCCRGDLALPRAEVEGVAVAARRLVPATGLRLPGTSLPGVIRAGSYGTGRTRDFWNVRRADTVLVLQLRPGAAYRRVVLEVPDPAAVLHTLRPVLGPYSGTFA